MIDKILRLSEKNQVDVVIHCNLTHSRKWAIHEIGLLYLQVVNCTATGIKLTRWPSCHWGKCYHVLSVIDLTLVERIIACTTHVKFKISKQLFSDDKTQLLFFSHLLSDLSNQAL